MQTLAALPVNLIDRNAGQPRETFHGIDELADSIASAGLLQPITVRKMGDRYEIVAGERRFRAVSKLGWPSIPALVVDIDDAETFRLAVLENLARRDMLPSEEANALQRLLDTGMTAEDVEKLTGIGWRGGNGNLVDFKCSLLRVLPEFAQLVDTGNLSMKKAHRLSRLTPDGQRRVMRIAVRQEMSYRQFYALCETIYGEENQLDMFPQTKAEPKARAQADRIGRHVDALAAAAGELAALEDGIGFALQHRAVELRALIDRLIPSLGALRREIDRYTSIDAEDLADDEVA